MVTCRLLGHEGRRPSVRISGSEWKGVEGKMAVASSVAGADSGVAVAVGSLGAGDGVVVVVVVVVGEVCNAGSVAPGIGVDVGGGGGLEMVLDKPGTMA